MTTEEKPTEKHGMELMTKIKIILVAIIAILVLIVIFQNTHPVTTRLLFMEVSMPRALLLIMMLAIGFAAGVLVTGAAYRKRTK
jgi:lipopolysaccharide assembly protein A